MFAASKEMIKWTNTTNKWVQWLFNDQVAHTHTLLHICWIYQKPIQLYIKINHTHTLFLRFFSMFIDGILSFKHLCKQVLAIFTVNLSVKLLPSISANWSYWDITLMQNSKELNPLHWEGKSLEMFVEHPKIYTLEDPYPTNHPFRKENDLPNLHDYVPC